jgi:hypothetical protein
MKKYLVAMLLAGIMLASQAQRTELGVFGGGSFYMGDLNPKMPFELTQPAYGVVYRHNFNNRVAIKANLIRGTVTGDDLVTKYREERGINFISDIYEAAVMMEFNFLDYFTGSSYSYISPYLFGGVGAFMFDPKANYAGTQYDLRQEQTEGISYSQFAIAFPFGIGVKYSLTNTIGLTLEWGMRKTTTDYLDDVSTIYNTQAMGLDNAQNPQPVFPFDPSGNFREGMQRGNSKDNDWYSFAGLSVIFRINFRGKADCDEPHRMRL